MLRVDGRVVYAASDLNDFLACEHRTALTREALERGLPRPDDDPAREIIARKGRLHERAALQRLEASGVAVVRVDEGDGTQQALEVAALTTRQAMASGAEAIYQATLIDGNWMGRADFLLRTDEPSALGPWSYDVADAKLGVSEKPEYLVQLCVYADLVAATQGTLPRTIRAILGDGREIPYETQRYIAYVRAARHRFERAVGALEASAVPDRVSACAGCAWAERCDEARRRIDHLSLTAGIRRAQIVRLRDAGVATVVSLASAAEAARPPKMAGTTFAKLQRQAQLQIAQRSSGIPSYQLLEPRAGAGFALLPEPDDGDVYFDMEGDPLYEPGVGLEYLFGAFVPATGEYVRFWGETRFEEKRAFEEFIDWLVAHRERYPRSHVYHYAPYEKTALRKLAMRHVTREREVDDLLRGEVLVDLYAVVCGAVAQSQESYSIKKLEPLYGFTRSTDVRKGDDSIVAFERYLLERQSQTRDDIIAYNREDCVSTHQLHHWLLRLHGEAEAIFGELPFRPLKDPQEPTDKERADEERRTALEAALLAVAAPDSPEHLLAQLLGYHRREAKPVQWAVFDRSDREGSYDAVADDGEALGGIELCEEVAPSVDPAKRRGNLIYTYRYPLQQHKLGNKPVDPVTRKSAGEVLTLDDDAGILRLKRSERTPHPRTLIPGWPIDTDAQQAALARLAQAAVDGTIEQTYPAAYDLLRKAPPRITGLLPGSHVQPDPRPGTDTIDPADVASLALRLDHSTLVVQGPPGTGKTYTGARVIAELLAAGKRVGVTSTGHHAINNLLHEVERVVAERGASFRGVKKGNGDGAFASRLAEPFIETVDANASFAEYDLVAGTGWLIARGDLTPVDVLVIDEAGQVSLADALAMATNARSLVVLGDPMQLAHVSLASHPDDAAASVLRHLLGDAATIDEHRGVFLDRTYRMHPALNDFVSEMAYEGRLRAAAVCSTQRIDARWHMGAGLRYVPVDHEGNSQSSAEEALAVAEIVDQLLGGTFVACNGSSRAIGVDDILVVSPYNAHVTLLRKTLRGRFGDGVRVGTVDKFQGQEAPVVIYSLAASSAEDAPRGAEFLVEENRFNVAVSRGRALAVLVCSPRIFATPCSSVDQLRAVAAFCAFAERSAASTPNIEPPAPVQLSLIDVA